MRDFAKSIHVGNASDVIHRDGDFKIKYNDKENSYELYFNSIYYDTFHTKQQALDRIELYKKRKADRGKVGNARSKEQLLADVKELEKYIKDHPDQGCEKEKRLLGEAKEELDKKYGVLVGNAKDKNGNELRTGDDVMVKTDDPKLNKGTIVSINGDNVGVQIWHTGGSVWTTPSRLVTKIGNSKIGNASNTFYKLETELRYAESNAKSAIQSLKGNFSATNIVSALSHCKENCDAAIKLAIEYDHEVNK